MNVFDEGVDAAVYRGRERGREESAAGGSGSAQDGDIRASA